MSKNKPNPARTLIQSLGGPTRVAELLGYDKQKGGVQRVANWQGRGIPAEVRLNRPDIFPPEVRDLHRAEATPKQEAAHG